MYIKILKARSTPKRTHIFQKPGSEVRKFVKLRIYYPEREHLITEVRRRAAVVFHTSFYEVTGRVIYPQTDRNKGFGIRKIAAGLHNIGRTVQPINRTETDQIASLFLKIGPEIFCQTVFRFGFFYYFIILFD